MRRVVMLCCAAAGCGISGDPTTTPHAPGEDTPPFVLTDPVRVTRVVDGDTVDVNIDATPDTVRFKGVNTPELYTQPPEAYAQQAHDFTFTHVGTDIDLEFDSGCPAPPLTACRDAYNRLLAYIRTADGSDLNAELLQAGMARVYIFQNENFDRKQAYLDLQAAAQAAQVGMWAP